MFLRICAVHRLNLMSEKSFNQLGRTFWETHSWLIFGINWDIWKQLKPVGLVKAGQRGPHDSLEAGLLCL